MKDIIIRGGRNLHPDELEEAAGQLAGVRQGRVAVFACPDPGTGTSGLSWWPRRACRTSEALAALRGRITALAGPLLGTPPDEVVLAAPGSVLKTTSGKTRRAAADHELADPGGCGPSGAPVAGVVLLAGDEAAVPGEQGRRGHGEHLGPLVAGDQTGQRREPQPAGGLIADPASLAAQHCVFMPQYQQFGVP